MIVLLAVLFPMVAMADPQTETVEPGIEAEIEQCRKDCIETTCAPQFRSCVNASGEATPSCKVMRDECEKRCVEVDCMT
jgi:hypothetical protein